MKPPASSWASANSFSATPVVADPPGVGLFEFRVTSVHPKSFQSFTDACVSHAATRRRVEPGFLGSWRTNVGGDLFELGEMIHHTCNDSRDSALAMMQKDPAWRVFTEITAPMLQKQSSEMFLPAVKCLEVAGGETDAMLRIKNLSTAPAKTPPGVFELRTYQLELGYNPIPKLIELMAHGLPSKLASDQKKKGTLVGMFFSDVGRLNRFVEIWRYVLGVSQIQTLFYLSAGDCSDRLP